MASMVRQTETGRRPLDLAHIVGHVDGLSTGSNAWLHRETGEVHELSEDPDDGGEAEAEIEELLAADKLIEIDNEPWEDHRRVERFLARLDDSDETERIADAWSRRGRGRWRRFKDALYKADLLSDWFAFRRDCVRTDVIRLLEAHEIEFRHDTGANLRIVR